MGRMGRNRLGLERIILMIFRMGLNHSFFGFVVFGPLSLSLSFPVPSHPFPSVSSVFVSFYSFFILTCTHVIEPSSYVQYLISQQIHTSETKKERDRERRQKGAYPYHP